MPRIFPTFLIAAAVGAAAYGAGKSGIPNFPFTWAAGKATADEAASETTPSGPVLYYRHPDGRAEYSARPKSTEDGRPFLAVHQSEEVSFDPQKPVVKAASPEQAVKDRKVLYYRNPMGLPDTSKMPKKDSMGMDYLPVYEGDESDGSTVKVSPGKLQRTGVKTAIAAEGKVSRKLTVPGTIVLDERLVSVVSMRTDAFIESVSDVTTGSRIKKGDVLFRYYSKEIAAAGAQYLAELKVPAAKSLDTGAALRLKNLGVQSAAIIQMATDKKVPQSLAYTALSDGVVLNRMAVNGMMAEPGATLFKIADTSRVWVLADVPETELGGVVGGQRVTALFDQKPGMSIEGILKAIYPEVEMGTRTVKVRVELANTDGFLLPNMYARIQIEVGGSSSAVTVPNSAIIDTGDRQIVFLDKGRGRFEPTSVTLGMRGEEVTEIRSGVAAGDRVVVSANFLLDAESNLNAALGAMTASEVQP